MKESFYLPAETVRTVRGKHVVVEPSCVQGVEGLGHDVWGQGGGG